MLHLWYAREAPSAPWVLGHDETRRHALLADEEARRAYARAHSLKRRVLSHYQPGCAPAAWHFVHGRAGKPAVANPFPFHFNLSHSGSRVAVAVAGREVGVDVEVHRPLPLAPALAERVFHAREQAWLERQPQYDTAFWRLWTMKEALLKAAGTGFSHPPAQVAWDGLDEPWARARFAGRHWHGCSLRAGDTALAVAIDRARGPAGSLRVVHVDRDAVGDALPWTPERMTPGVDTP